MKTIIGILLVGFLGFLGCSGSDNDTNTIGKAEPVAPFGNTDTTTPTYMWTPVPWATRYCLLVEDIYEAPVIEEWYTAEEAGCASEDVLCSVTPEIVATGITFLVLACAGEECGLWGDKLPFSYIVAGVSGPRFSDHGDGTVTDNNTRLMWTKKPDGGSIPWNVAYKRCRDLSIANHNDWYLPSKHELNSLVDRSHGGMPAVPLGHPFEKIKITRYNWADCPPPEPKDFFRPYCEDHWGISFARGTWDDQNSGPIFDVLNYSWCLRAAN